MVLHTWGQNLGQHIHVHCVCTGGALSPDGQRWLPARKGFLFPRPALSSVFRGKYLDFLAQAYRTGELRMPGSAHDPNEAHAFDCLLTWLRSQDWVVYAKAPFASAEHVLAYLGRYTHRVAIANHRLVSFEAERVRFRWRDYAHGNKLKVMALEAGEFVRRFLLHTLPRGFTRLRYYGLLANRHRAQKLARCRNLIGQCTPQPREPESVPAMMLRLTGIDITRCPRCRRGTLRQILVIPPLLPRRLLPAPTGPP